MFENKSGTVTLAPFSGAQCSVNGVLVTEPSQLNQGEKSISVSQRVLRILKTWLCLGRCRHFTGQNQYVSLQPSQGSSKTAGETEGGSASSCCCTC